MRLVRIDTLRGVAVILMVIFHIFAIRDGGSPIVSSPYDTLLSIVGRTSGTLFLLLFGVSFFLTETKHKQIGSYILRRTLLFGAIASAITLVTLVFTPHAPVVFGIFHLLTVATLLLPIFRGRRLLVLGGAIGLLALSPIIRGVVLDSSIGLPFGLPYPWFTSLDYYPIIPHFAYILFGYVLASLVLDRPRVRAFFGVRGSLLERGIAFIGRHALIVYLVHIPLLWVFWQWYARTS